MIPLFMWLHHHQYGERDCRIVGTCVKAGGYRYSEGPEAGDDELPSTTEVISTPEEGMITRIDEVAIPATDAKLTSLRPKSFESETAAAFTSKATFTLAKKNSPLPPKTRPTTPVKKVTPRQNPQVAKPPNSKLFMELVKAECGGGVSWKTAVDVGLANWQTSGISSKQIEELCVRKAVSGPRCRSSEDNG